MTETDTIAYYVSCEEEDFLKCVLHNYLWSKSYGEYDKLKDAPNVDRYLYICKCEGYSLSQYLDVFDTIYNKIRHICDDPDDLPESIAFREHSFDLMRLYIQDWNSDLLVKLKDKKFYLENRVLTWYEKERIKYESIDFKKDLIKVLDSKIIPLQRLGRKYLVRKYATKILQYKTIIKCKYLTTAITDFLK